MPTTRSGSARFGNAGADGQHRGERHHHPDFGTSQGKRAVMDVVSPWWKNAAWPWIKDKGEILVAALKNEKTKAERIKTPELEETRLVPTVLPDVENQKLDTVLLTMLTCGIA